MNCNEQRQKGYHNNIRWKQACEILSSHSGDDNDSSLLGNDDE
jgi:hypothetical protein